MQCHATRLWSAHVRMTLRMNSLPLSLITMFSFTRPPFAHPEGVSEMGDSFPLGRGRLHFFKRSFKAALSSIASASGRFSRVFSSSSGLPLGLRDLRPTELGLPFVDTGVADAMLAALIGDRHAGLMLLQNPGDLLFRKAAALLALFLVVGQNELQTGLTPRSKVRTASLKPSMAGCEANFSTRPLFFELDDVRAR